MITLNHVLYYVTDVAGLLDKCMKWLKPRGCIIITLGDENAFTKEMLKGQFTQLYIFPIKLTLNPYNAELILHKSWRPKGFNKFKIIINVLVISF